MDVVNEVSQLALFVKSIEPFLSKDASYIRETVEKCLSDNENNSSIVAVWQHEFLTQIQDKHVRKSCFDFAKTLVAPFLENNEEIGGQTAENLTVLLLNYIFKQLKTWFESLNAHQMSKMG